MVKVVILQKKGSINGLSQQRVDGNHDEKHCQLQDRVETKKDCTSHHCQHTSEDKILDRKQHWLILVITDKHLCKQLSKQKHGKTILDFSAQLSPFRAQSALKISVLLK